jgi:CRISPR-associated protein Csb2
MTPEAALLVRVGFPRGAYSGGDFGSAEELPSPARIHAAFVSAAGGGPGARADGRALVADASHETAVRWLEDNEPIGLLAPVARLTDYRVRRYRLRAAPDHSNETDFEPFSALDGVVTYAWPPPESTVLVALRELAAEVTHIGRADSTAIVDVTLGEVDPHGPGFLRSVSGRGPGRALRVPTPGRFVALVEAHGRAMRPGGHRTGSGGVQASDTPVESAGETATRLRRFASLASDAAWPFSEAWEVPLDGQLPSWALRVDRRVSVAVAIHRAIVAAIGTDVPPFVSGRDGGAPLRGAGHLAIQLVMSECDETRARIVFALPPNVPEADRAVLLEALAGRPAVRLGGRTLRLGLPTVGPALAFWSTGSGVMATEVPMVLDAPGVPRHGEWTLDDAVLCSLGYALRAVLERRGTEWGSGWKFRRALVTALREHGAEARADRVHGSASRFAHRAREGDLLVAVHAAVRLGDLAAGGHGLLALGRARHLGGGLLRPVARRQP